MCKIFNMPFQIKANSPLHPVPIISVLIIAMLRQKAWHPPLLMCTKTPHLHKMAVIATKISPPRQRQMRAANRWDQETQQKKEVLFWQVSCSATRALEREFWFQTPIFPDAFLYLFLPGKREIFFPIGLCFLLIPFCHTPTCAHAYSVFSEEIWHQGLPFKR